MNAAAVLGAVCWLGVVALASSGAFGLWIIEALFLLAPLVLVPLALDRVGEPAIVRRLQPLCAILATASFLVTRGRTAGVLAAAWLAFTALIGFRGLVRLGTRRLSAAELAIDAGFVFLPVGGAWLVLSRLGVRPLGFEEPTILLTAVHFHFAAFTALVLTGLAGRHRPGLPLFPAIVGGAVTGTPLLAAGLTFSSPGCELLGAAVVAASFGGLGLVSLARVLPSVPNTAARLLLGVSAISVTSAMVLALAYAWGRFSGAPIVALSLVARVHGPLNAIGFGGCGLAGWTLARHPP
jgi:hypothetical protein